METIKKISWYLDKILVILISLGVLAMGILFLTHNISEIYANQDYSSFKKFQDIVISAFSGAILIGIALSCIASLFYGEKRIRFCN